MKKYKCQCSNCATELLNSAPENILHRFVGNHPSNLEISLDEFEEAFDFASVIHWDVGYSKVARYYVYRDLQGNLIAWYDKRNSMGFQFNPTID